MEDFESLLRGAARHENELMSEAAISEMIDKRLVASKSKLQTSFRKEIWIIVFCIVSFIGYIALAKYVYRNTLKPDLLNAYIMICCGGILYFLASIVLFMRLLRLSLLEKDRGIRNYVTVLYTKTKQAVQLYFWVSVVVAIGMIAAMLLSYRNVPLYVTILITVVGSVIIYYVNIWYTDMRFGRKLRELKQLIAEFNEPDN